MTAPIVAAARRLADDLLFPTATAVDSGDDVPRERLDALAAAGMYALLAPPDAGGPDVDYRVACRVVEEIAGGCLTTAFVWLQHLGTLRAVAGAGAALRTAWLLPMARGDVRAGVAVAGVRPGAREPLRAAPVDGGWALDGVAPWVTGWGLVDVIRVAALDPDGDLVWLLVDAVTGPTLTVERVRLAALDASATVVARFDRHVVAGERLVGRTPYQQWQDDDAKGLRLNGSLALGVAARCARLLGSAAIERDLATCRNALDDAHERADVGALPTARAAASELALRAAAATVVARGAPAVQRDQDAQRLLREATFTLVFGSRAPMKEALLAALTGDLTS